MNRLLTVDQVAEHLQLHPATIRRYIKEGKLAAAKFGTVWRISQEDLEELIRERRKPREP
jgi:excisionase family DNA binding protein